MKGSVICAFGLASTLVYGQSQDAHVFWASPYHDGHIHYACFCDDVWGVPVQLSAGDGLNVTPSVEKTGDGYVVFWSNVNYDGRIAAHYVIYSDGQWSSPERLDTGVASATAVNGTLDDTGRLWITWSGNTWEFKGKAGTSDVYAGVFEGGQFGEIKRIHADNDDPDLHPQIAIDRITRTPVITWRTLGDDAAIVRYATYTNNAWHEVNAGQIDAPFNKSSNAINVSSGLVPLASLGLRLPDFIDPEQDQIAVLFEQESAAVD